MLAKENIHKILKFTNVVSEDDVVLEECGDYYPALLGYKIVLPKSKFMDMNYLMTRLYSAHESLCNATFKNGNVAEIVQLCKIFRGEETYTETFINLFDGADNLIASNGDPVVKTGLFDDDDFEEEDPEVIKELEDRIKVLEAEKAELEKNISEITSSKDTVISELKESIEGDKPVVDFFKEINLEDDHLGLCLDVLDQISDLEVRETLMDMLQNRATENPVDLKLLGLYTVDLANSFDRTKTLDRLGY